MVRRWRIELHPALFPGQSVDSACNAARIGEHIPNLGCNRPGGYAGYVVLEVGRLTEEQEWEQLSATG
jgi:hypothetical protein